MVLGNCGGGRGVVGRSVAAMSTGSSVGWGVLGRKQKNFMSLSRIRFPVGLGAMTGRVEMGVQRKGCRPHCPVRNDTHPRGPSMVLHGRVQDPGPKSGHGTTHTNTISKLGCGMIMTQIPSLPSSTRPPQKNA